MMRYAIIALASLVAILLYLLAIATGNTSKLEEFYWWLLGFNIVLLFALLGMIVRQLIRLRQRVKARVFGAKLAQRLVTMFALVALVPGVLVFTISVQFLTHSIESWFDVRVESALDRGLELGKNALNFVLEDAVSKSRVILDEIENEPTALLFTRLERLRQQLNLREVALFNYSGKLLAFSSELPASFPQMPARDIVRKLRLREPLGVVESDSDDTLLLKVALAYRTSHNEMRVLQVIQQAPESISRSAEQIETARADYRGLLLTRHGLKTFYMLTLVLSFLLALAFALAFALFLSERLSAPLTELAAGTRAVAQGDFTKRHPVYRRDELGILTTMFNRMTQQLDEARQTAELQRNQLEASKIYLESILANLSAGVIAFDAGWFLRASNISASRILGVDFSDVMEQPLPSWPMSLGGLHTLVSTILDQASSNTQPGWQLQINYSSVQGERILLVRGAKLVDHTGSGYVVVFDDITELARAQRDAAWGEVAKRLAHEIRNPLTPIQLSAERLTMKLSTKLSSADAEMLRRLTDTIIKQVNALKAMVDAFRDYARTPAIRLEKLDLNEVIREVMTLYETNLAVRVNLTPGPLFIMGDAALLRQVLHNLIQNAQDAVLDVGIPMIQISSREEERSAVVCIQDNGFGFDIDILPRAFEPYVTNKTKGTGLGLAVVKKIVEEHHGHITLGNDEQHGARILLTMPLLEA